MILEKLGINFEKTYTYKISEKRIVFELNKLKLEANDGDIIYNCESISRLERNVDDNRDMCDY